MKNPTLHIRKVGPPKCLLIALTALLLAMPAAGAAQEVEARSGFSDGPVGLGLGLGDPAAVDVKFWTSRDSGLNLGVGLENLDDVLGVYGEYEFGLIDFALKRALGVFYVGVGGSVAFHDGADDVGVAAIIPVGLDFRFRVPLDLFLEARPGVEILDDPPAFAIGAQLGLRYTF